MKLAITGEGVLAVTTRHCCAPHFDIVSLADADLVWVCYDVPLNPESGFSWALDRLVEDIIPLRFGALVLVSSQMPVGTTVYLEWRFPHVEWAYSPENIRVASPVEDFKHQARIVVGRRTARHDDWFNRLLSPFTDNIIYTDPETAEMSKHALNAWLGMNIAFINEIARLCDVAKASVDVVTGALLSDARVGKTAPLWAGAPFGGGHLARDINVLNQLAFEKKIATPLISSILQSNRGSI